MLLSTLAYADELTFRNNSFPTIDKIYELLDEYDINAKTFSDNDDGSIRIEYDAMDYHVHVPNRIGRMQKWFSVRGPNNKGIVFEININDKKYEGPMKLPQQLPIAYSPYFETYINDIQENEKYLYTRAKFGKDVDETFKSKVLQIIYGTFYKKRGRDGK
jgi:hypothetical protein